MQHPDLSDRRVLVMGDDVRSFLSVVRSLGRLGLQVDVVAEDQSSPALKSRYIAKALRLPPYALGSEAWAETLQSHMKTGKYTLVVPCDDRTILPLLHHREEFAQTRIALPNDDAYDAFYDKLETRHLAASVGVPTAPGRALTPGDSAETLAVEFGLPLVIKPRRSYTVETLSSRGRVHICQTTSDIDKALPDESISGEFLVEGFFVGSGAGVSVLAHRGEVLQAFQHARLRESSSGGSSYRISQACSPRLLEAAQKLAAAAALHGVAMVEFRHDRSTGDFILIEVNARFWGSLPLAIASGVDFPALLYRMLVDDQVPEKSDYQIGMRARAISADVTEAAEAFSRKRRESFGAALLYVTNAGLGWLRLLSGREVHDSFAWDDPAPWWAEVATLIKQAGSKLWRKTPLADKSAHSHAARTVRRSMPKTILVLCQGNICRSPYAAKRLEQALYRRDVAVVSAGLMDRVDRPSPAVAQQAASSHGIDLSDHRSRYADDGLIEESDLVVLFDAINEAGLKARGAWEHDKALRLGALIPDASDQGTIEDPINGTPEDFDACYDRIDQAVEHFTALIEDKPQ